MPSRRMFCVLVLAPFLAQAASQNGLPFNPADLKVELNGVFLPGPHPDDTASTRINIPMGLHVHGIPSRYFLQVRKAAVVLKTQGGESLPVHPAEPRRRPDPPNSAVQAALRGSRLFAPAPRPFSIVPLFAMQNDLLQNYRADWLRFAAKVEFQIMECRETVRLPLRQGAKTASGRIEFVKHLKDAVEVKLADSPKEGDVCVLQNTSRREAFLGVPT
jgi:hypothetical protein